MKLLLVLAVLAGAYAQVNKYNGYKVFRVTPSTEEQVNLLRQLEDSPLGFDFWKSPSVKNVPVDIMVAPHQHAQFGDMLRTLELPADNYILDVQELIDTTTSKDRSTPRAFDWTNYHRGADINAWLDSLQEQYPDKVEVVTGGKSYEGREIKGVKLSFKTGNKGVFLEGGIHAREWIAPATVTYILNELLTSTDPAVREVAESYDWYVFPSINPDGYEYTHTTDRLWRKTRQPHGLCKGADPNRNWGYHWMNGGASNQPCSETYAGSKAFSEPETKSLSEYITSISANLVGYIGFHSYSQLLLIPYGDSPAHVENYDELYDIGKKAAASLAKRYGTEYTVGNIVEVIYVASGGSMDWVKGVHHTPLTYTYELRDTGRHGFVLPPDQIIPTGEETLDSLVTIMQEAKTRGY